MGNGRSRRSNSRRQLEANLALVVGSNQPTFSRLLVLGLAFYRGYQRKLTVPPGILPSALAFGQLLDRRLKALLDILACGYLKLLTVIVSDPHTVLVDPTVLDFANASCCHDVAS